MGDAVLLLLLLYAVKAAVFVARGCTGAWLHRDVGSFGTWYTGFVLLAVSYVLWLNKDRR